MADSSFKATLVDYDEDLFAPPNWVGKELARHGIEWVVGQYRSPEAASSKCSGDMVRRPKSLEYAVRRIPFDIRSPRIISSMVAIYSACKKYWGIQV